jgi:hypothetical protein
MIQFFHAVVIVHSILYANDDGAVTSQDTLLFGKSKTHLAEANQEVQDTFLINSYTFQVCAQLTLF